MYGKNKILSFISKDWCDSSVSRDQMGRIQVRRFCDRRGSWKSRWQDLEIILGSHIFNLHPLCYHRSTIPTQDTPMLLATIKINKKNCKYILSGSSVCTAQYIHRHHGEKSFLRPLLFTSFTNFMRIHSRSILIGVKDLGKQSNDS